MLWILHKLAAYMNQPYDHTKDLEALRERQKKRVDSDDDRRA